MLLYYPTPKKFQSAELLKPFNRSSQIRRFERSAAVEQSKALNVLNNNIHSAHCRACKERVRELLTAIYGECAVNHRFPWSTHPEDYRNTSVGNSLEVIRDALRDWRGHRDFIKSPQVPPCDFYLSAPPFILEFDESQHFSRARLVTLEFYPRSVELGFSPARWQQLCRAIDARDDRPIDRDERRAWYDALRDLVPSAYGFTPTVRLYAADYNWCSLDPTKTEDQQTFLSFLPTERREH